jgi:D-glycero-alpha-D-manno-heptose 1-phosphate guanylyltransferase
MLTEAIVLAGGLGTRLRGVVTDVPKPMAPIGGRPFLEYLFDHWIGQGIQRFTLSVGYRHEAITGHFGNAYRGAALRYAVEPAPLGTGGALLRTLGAFRIESPVLLLNGDTYFAVDLDRLSGFAAESTADIAFALFETNDRVRYMGMDVDAQGRILELQARDRSPHLANGGVYWLAPGVFVEHASAAERPQSLETDLLPALFRAGRKLYGLAFPGTFIDIGVPDDFRRAQDLLPSTGRVRHASC